MSEFAPRNIESQEALPSPERHEALPTPEQAHHEKAAEQRLDTNEVRRAVAEHARTEASHNPFEAQVKHEGPKADSPRRLSTDLKAIMLRREVRAIQRRETPAERTLSRIIHTPAVRVASEAAGHSAGRPSGLLGGGITALLGSSIYLYLARHLGFQYNYGMFIVLFAGGFMLGLLVEMAVHVAVGERHATD